MITVPIEFFTEGEPEAAAIARWLARIFEYVRDVDNPITGKVPEHWPPRSLIESELASSGKVVDDCDGSAFTAVYALADFGVKARVICGTVEVPHGTFGSFVDDRGNNVAGHMVAEDEHGNVIDNRHPGLLMTWPELLREGYRKTIMSGFFEFEPEPRWTEAL